jgi:hypothetical protein
MKHILDPYLSGKVIEFDDGSKELIGNYNIPKPDKELDKLVNSYDTLFSIAQEYFNGDTSQWYMIALHNNIVNPFELPVGETIKIPIYEN